MASMITAAKTNLFIRNCLENNTSSYQKSMEQLSSGNRYTTLGENPMAVATATNLSVEINFNNTVKSNINTGTDMLTMAEGYQETILSNIERIYDLTIQANNGAYSSTNKNDLIKEIQARLNQINDLSANVDFNGTKILNGSVPDLSLKIGEGASDTVNIGSVLTDVSTTTLGINLASPMTDADWSNYLNSIENASTILTDNCAKIGSIINRLDSVSNTLDAKNIDLSEYKSAISDTDTAESSADLVKYQILQQAATSIFVQTNKINQLPYSLFGMSS